MQINKNKKQHLNEELDNLLQEENEVNNDLSEEAVEEIVEEVIKETVEEVSELKDNNKELTLDEKIIKWKMEHDELFETIISGVKFVWKPLSRNEYKDAYSKDIDRDLYIVKAACLYPSQEYIERVIERKAGISYVLTEIILGESGFNVQSSSKL